MGGYEHLALVGTTAVVALIGEAFNALSVFQSDLPLGGRSELEAVCALSSMTPPCPLCWLCFACSEACFCCRPCNNLAAGTNCKCGSACTAGWTGCSSQSSHSCSWPCAGSRMIYVANCGDSRAVLCRDGGALALTDDHKAAREDETVSPWLGGCGC